MGHLDAGGAREHHVEEMRDAARRGGSVEPALGLLLHESDVLGEGGRRHLRAHAERELEVRKVCEWLEVVERVVAQFGVGVRIDGHRGDRGHEQRMAVGRGAFTVSFAICPPAPVRFSTITACPSAARI